MQATNIERLYGGADPNAEPRYGAAEAARYIKIAPSTIRSWMVGTAYDGGFFYPLIEPAQKSPLKLAFTNLVEAHVLRALRTEHGLKLPAIRTAIDYAESELRVTRLLLHSQLRTDGAELLLDEYSRLINLGRAGQLGIRKVLEEHLKRMVWDSSGSVSRLLPFVNSVMQSYGAVIAIDPLMSFGKPFIVRRGISTGVIASRLDGDESVDSLAYDYGLTVEEIEAAAIYEAAAA